MLRTVAAGYMAKHEDGAEQAADLATWLRHCRQETVKFRPRGTPTLPPTEPAHAPPSSASARDAEQARRLALLGETVGMLAKYLPLVEAEDEQSAREANKAPAAPGSMPAPVPSTPTAAR
ncbi:hypothetical protein EON67_03810 [archaeon]|nr:MAG: hypothetical protein EON67_03810 [archaeon]